MPALANTAARTIIRAYVGGSVGLAIGLLGGLSYGLIGCMGPVVGAVVGAGFAALVHPRVGVAFLLGWALCAAALYYRFNSEAHSQIGPNWRADIEDSPLYLVGPVGPAIGGGMIGGALATIAPLIVLCRKRAPDAASSGVGIALMAGFGLPMYLLAHALFSEWVSFETDYQARMRGAFQAEVRRQAPGPRDLPIRMGAYLYPRRTRLRGDSFIVSFHTVDSVSSVVAYYRKLGASMVNTGGTWEGSFPYEGKNLAIRVAPSGAGTNGTLKVAGF